MFWALYLVPHKVAGSYERLTRSMGMFEVGLPSIRNTVISVLLVDLFAIE